jgi:hypothetical protein
MWPPPLITSKAAPRAMIFTHHMQRDPNLKTENTGLIHSLTAEHVDFVSHPQNAGFVHSSKAHDARLKFKITALAHSLKASKPGFIRS